MDDKDSGSCLAEMRRKEEKETPSGRSTRASLVKLPKIGVFSSSSKSVNAVEETSNSQTRSADGDQLPTTLTSNPSSRQGRTENASTLTTQQLEIQVHINLSGVLDHAKQERQETPKRKVTPKREEKEETRIGSTSTTLPSQDGPSIWERNSVVSKKGRLKGESRERTKTWPALQYKLWLDSSNLPLHLLCNDERANRPQRILLPQVARKSAKSSSRPSSSINNSFNFKLNKMPANRDKSQGRDWSVKFLSVSQPPFRPDKKNNDGGILSRKTEEGGKRVTEAAAADVNGLQVGVGESWQVATSYSHRPESRQKQNQKSIGRLRSVGGVNNNNLPQVGKGTYPRIPSRMGQNNLDSFLKQNTNLGDMSHSHSGDPIPGLARANTCTNLSSSPPSKLQTAAISPRYFCNTSAEVRLLTLRSYARNPKMLQELTERNKYFNPDLAVHKSESIRSVKLEQDAVRHVRFKVPCGGADEDETIAMARSKNSSGGGMGNVILSDVTPPQTPPNFDRSLRISVLPDFCHQ